MTIRQHFEPGDDMPTAEEWNDILRAGDVPFSRSRPIKVILSGDSSPYSWDELDGDRTGEETAYELNEKEDLGGKNAVIYPSTHGHYVFQYRTKGFASTGFIQVTVRNACTRATIAGSTVTIKNNLGVVVATGTASGLGVYTSPELPISGSPYTVTATGSGLSDGTSSVTLTTAGATVTTIVEPIGAPSVWTMTVLNGCNDPLEGAFVSVTGPNGYASSGYTDAAGVFLPTPIPRAWAYRGMGVGSGQYDYVVTHPEWRDTGDGSGFMLLTCLTNNIANSPQLRPKVCRHYSGRVGDGTACYDKEYPPTVTVDVDFSGLLGYQDYSGVYVLSQSSCDPEILYSFCLDAGDVWLSIGFSIDRTIGACDEMNGIVGAAFYAKGPEYDPCSTLVDPEPVVFVVQATGHDMCIDTLNMTGLRATVTN